MTSEDTPTWEKVLLGVWALAVVGGIVGGIIVSALGDLNDGMGIIACGFCMIFLPFIILSEAGLISLATIWFFAGWTPALVFLNPHPNPFAAIGGAIGAGLWFIFLLFTIASGPAD